MCFFYQQRSSYTPTGFVRHSDALLIDRKVPDQRTKSKNHDDLYYRFLIITRLPAWHSYILTISPFAYCRTILLQTSKKQPSARVQQFARKCCWASKHSFFLKEDYFPMDRSIFCPSKQWAASHQMADRACSVSDASCPKYNHSCWDRLWLY